MIMYDDTFVAYLIYNNNTDKVFSHPAEYSTVSMIE